MGGLNIEVRGTLKFIIDDEDGITHTISVPNSVNISDLPMVLVSPQHWSHQTSDGTESTSGANITTLTFSWYRKNIPYSAQSNTPSFCSTSGTLRYQYFSTMVDHRSTSSKTFLRSKHVVTDNESSSPEGAPEGDTGEHNG